MVEKIAGIVLIVLIIGSMVGAAVQITAESIRGLSASGRDSLLIFLVAWALSAAAAFWVLKRL